MERTFKHRQAQQGFSLVEVLVTLVILMIGLLGLVGLMVTSQRAQMESYQRVQAVVVVQDMVDRINTNRIVAPCYVVTTKADGSPNLGTDSAGVPACALGTAEQQAQAKLDLEQWHALLLGSTEAVAGSNAGAMLGARGCIEETAPGVYRVSVVWQGSTKTVAPQGVSCGSNLYGEETLRRAVTMPVMIAKLG